MSLCAVYVLCAIFLSSASYSVFQAKNCHSEVMRILKSRERFIKYNYHDTPNGQDLVPKLICVMTRTGHLGLIGGIYFGLTHHNRGLANGIGRGLRFIVTGLGAGFAWTSTVYYLTKYRKKDQPANYFWGGIATSPVLGWALRQGTQGLVLGILIGGSGMVYNYYRLQGKNAISENIDPASHSSSSHLLDWSLTPHIPGNWTRGESLHQPQAQNC